MGRVSRQQAEQHREQVVAAAARLFRERGTQVSVADLMAAIGLTHGGFYRQFASKDALVGEAAARAFVEAAEGLRAIDEQHPDDPAAALDALLDGYLTPEHRDEPGLGCPSAGLCVDVARQPADGPAREPFAAGVEGYAEWLGEHRGGDLDDGLATLATLVGAMLLARATAGTPVSDRVLVAARESLHK